AQKVDASGSYTRDRFISSFIGFTPAENPRAVILVVIDEPKGKYYGGVVAAPVFKRIASETLSYMNVPPDEKHRGHARVKETNPAPWKRPAVATIEDGTSG
ncbi:MAG: penicillin-binding protein, partial [Desulfobacterales bacterium]|nr:penicillin-binding protein [Desulfobacterales bacterium]